jgi:ATP-binding cassette subfamily C (CFTR/MRP) protein 1
LGKESLPKDRCFLQSINLHLKPGGFYGLVG